MQTIILIEKIVVLINLAVPVAKKIINLVRRKKEK